MARVLVIVPAYNEEDTIASVLATMREHNPGYDVVVVDDGSRDRTADIVRGIDGVELIPLPCNLGIGGAMQTGYKYAFRNGYDVAVQCDADGQHPVERVHDLVTRVLSGDADMVIGSRYVTNTGYAPSFSRRVGKSILSRIVDLVVGGGITDTTSGFRAMNRKVLKVFAERYPEDYPEAEALVIMHKSGLRCIEIPVEMRARQGGSTSIKPPHALYYMLKVVLAIFVDVFRKFTKAEGDR